MSIVNRQFVSKIFLSVILASIALLLLSLNVEAVEITPEATQYLEFRVVSVTPIARKR